MPHVFIVILNWKSARETCDLVTSLENNLDYDNFTILIVDNCSPDGSGQALRDSLPDHRLHFTDRNLGYAGGNNIGIDAAIREGADYIWILNPDIRVEPDALRLLVDEAEKDKTIAAIGPRICNRDDKGRIYSDGGRIDPSQGYYTYHEHSNRLVNEIPSKGIFYDIDYVNGSAFLIRSNAIKQIGLLREDFFLYFEETEWCIRAKRNNWKLAINTQSVVYHRASPKKYRYYYYMTRNRIWLAKLYDNNYKKTVSILLSEILKQARKPNKKNIMHIFAQIQGVIAGQFQNPHPFK